MITVKTLKSLLEQYPDNAKCYAYEGEDVGLGIIVKDDKTDKENYSFIRCTQKDEED